MHKTNTCMKTYNSLGYQKKRKSAAVDFAMCFFAMHPPLPFLMPPCMKLTLDGVSFSRQSRRHPSLAPCVAVAAMFPAMFTSRFLLAGGMVTQQICYGICTMQGNTSETKKVKTRQRFYHKHGVVAYVLTLATVYSYVDMCTRCVRTFSIR